ncbi:hypothetical protein SAMN05216212_2727 [Microbulbifer yueqingensis]|uniref:Uncharacterized protein n=2 Tax=Microbulbifer yueqingensis TaxID=658219 RepID=A0A1G9DC49_9GAMM|nr:hypothetical protein SAMN05216212_2727 [Microbulbifer yueqingensis]
MMAGNTRNSSGYRASRLRLVAWAGAVTMLLLPAIAMQFTEEVNWQVADFVVFGALLFGAGIAYELAVRMTPNASYRVAAGLALAAGFLLAWLSLGVGVIGRDGDPANLMFFGVLGVGIVGALMARFRPAGMAWALFATALAQGLAAGIALMAKLGQPWSGPFEILLLNGFFVAMFSVAALLFLQAERQGSAA